MSVELEEAEGWVGAAEAVEDEAPALFDNADILSLFSYIRSGGRGGRTEMGAMRSHTSFHISNCCTLTLLLCEIGGRHVGAKIPDFDNVCENHVTPPTRMRTHARTHAQTHVRMHACTHARMHARMHTRARERTQARTRARLLTVILYVPTHIHKC